jgi:thioredoxin-related protein
MKIQVLIISVFVLILSAGLNAQNKKAKMHAYIPVTKFDTTRDAQKDLNDAVAEAKKTNRRVYVDVGGDWCIWCHRLDDFYGANKDLQEYLDKHYIFVKINFSKENKNEAVLSKFPKIEGYPHVFILDKNGKLVKSKDTGELEQGKGYNHDKVMTFLKEFARKG